MANKDRDAVYIATTSGCVALPDGREFTFRQGQTKIAESHPVMRTTCRVNFELDPTAGVTDYVQR
jgi:hypothetical protein